MLRLNQHLSGDSMMQANYVISSVAGLAIALGLYVWNQRGRAKVVTKSDVDAVSLTDKLKLTSRNFYDLTTTINENTVVYPGDPKFERKDIAKIGEESSFGLQHMSFCNHSGTHIDFPAHVLKDGKTSSDYDIEKFIMDGVIIEVPRDYNSISKDFISQLRLNPRSCVFFKTRNSEVSKQTSFIKDYVYFEPEAAEALLNKQVSVVGIDYISVDSSEAEELPVHKILLSKDVLIVENLELKGIEPGNCKIFIAPTKIADMDGLPARVFMMR